ncbi:hypothetical protein [Nostoc sp. DedQUE09]|uniref:hypothetical protein n=1 Tax=Nostoc sp. DedQUE09 TaxID=3075394 RepID=UPI002AD2ABEA|nr:hypothetical protein [Nostoc sp. DedQUE09]MDZ7951454.1 hypothetical protein [Nostoc sp. DedQUE09]
MNDFFTKFSNYLQINSKKITIIEKFSIRFNEQLLKLAWNAIAIHNNKAEVVVIQGVGRDITEQQAAQRERQLAEAALRRSEEKFCNFAENTHVIVHGCYIFSQRDRQKIIYLHSYGLILCQG